MLHKREAEAAELRRKNQQLEGNIRGKDSLIDDYVAYKNQLKKDPVKPRFTKALVPNVQYSGPPSYPQRNQGPQFEPLLQNNARNKDLNDFERAFVFLNAQESDNLEMLMNVPVGTDLYRYKVEQLKETSTTRSEVEKLAYERMLRSMKKSYEAHNKEIDRMQENLTWDDQARREYIAARIRKDRAPFPRLEWAGYPDLSKKKKKKEEPKSKKKPEEYDQIEGYNVLWDYCLGLNKSSGDVVAFDFQVVKNGQILREVDALPEVKVESESNKTCRSIFDMNSLVRDIPPDPDTLMIWKVKQRKSDSDEYEVVGWTQIDLFGLDEKLKRGRWKCPLYELPYDTNITKAAIKKLTPTINMWHYLRISFPWGDKYSKSFKRPEKSSYLAEIPEIHRRVEAYVPEIKKPETPPLDLSSFSSPSTPERPEKEEEDPKPEDDKLPEANLEDEHEEDDLGPQAEPLPYQKKGMTLEMKRLFNYAAEYDLKIAMACYQSS